MVDSRWWNSSRACWSRPLMHVSTGSACIPPPPPTSATPAAAAWDGAARACSGCSARRAVSALKSFRAAGRQLSPPGLFRAPRRRSPRRAAGHLGAAAGCTHGDEAINRHRLVVDGCRSA